MCVLEPVESRKPPSYQNNGLGGRRSHRYYWNYNEREFLQPYTVYLDDVMSQNTKSQWLAVDYLQGSASDAWIKKKNSYVSGIIPYRDILDIKSFKCNPRYYI